jgi:putative RecB family exonuclease
MVASEFQNHLHISHSQLDTFLNCPQRYRYQYVVGTPWEHLPASLAFGRAIHAAVAHYYRHVKHFEEPLPLAVLKGCFHGEFQEALAQGLEVLYEDGESETFLREKGEALLEVFHAKARPQTVEAVERPFLVDLVDPATGEVLDVKLAVVFDLIESDASGNLTIADLKTAKRRYAENQVENHLQATLYAYALRRLGYSTDGRNTLIRFDVLLKTKQPDLESYYAVKAEEDEPWTLAQVRRVLRAIEEGAYFPIRSWRCPDCPFRRRCAADLGS